MEEFGWDHITRTLQALQSGIPPQSVNIPLLEGSGSLRMTSFSCAFDKALSERIPIYAVHNVSERTLDEENYRRVHKAFLDGRPVIYKMDPLRSKLRGSGYDKCTSFRGIAGIPYSGALDRVRCRLKLPKSPHIQECLGLVYAEDVNLWGEVYELIDGKRIPTPYQNRKEALKMARGVAETLKMLDQHEYAYHYLRPENVLIKKDGTPVLIGDIVGITDNPLESRHGFGGFLISILNESDYIVLKPLIEECTSEKSMIEFGWDHILSALDQLIE